ncbi:MAG TPA: DUF3467 domain-containing protein [Pirellulales bacterium]|nr:DUF3467 domain-containing protein [Pirellulales bacterium]
MNADDQGRPEGEPNPPPPGAVNEQLQHASVSARVPAHIGHGIMSTGAVVFDGPHEFVIDFLQRLGAPHSVAARVTLSHAVFAQFIQALRDNLKMYEGRFGAPAPLPAPPQPPPRTSISELYEQLKLPDEMLSGVYSNAVMIGHTPSEFWFDFITTFYPRSAVSCRVFLSAQQVPGLLDTLASAQQAHQRRRTEQPPGNQLPGSQPPGPQPPNAG